MERLLRINPSQLKNNNKFSLEKTAQLNQSKRSICSTWCIITYVCMDPIYNKFVYLQQVFSMGNSKSKPGIYIQTEKQFYLPGEIVKGCVYINAPQPYPVAKILLSVMGLEKTWWRHRENNNNNNGNGASNGSMNNLNGRVRPNQTVIPLSGDRIGQVKIIQANFTLNSWGNNSTNLQGQMAFPFQFQLPSFVPGSFRQQTNEYKASVVYQIQCRCISPKKSTDDVVAIQQLIIREPKKNSEESLFGESYIYPQTCFCRKNGVFRVRCYFEKNQYITGEQCIAICEVDNYKCRLNIREVKVKFKKVITLTSGFGEDKVFEQEINRALFPGVAANGQYPDLAKRIKIPLKYRDSKSVIHPTTNGRLVKCHYYLQVTPQVSGWFLKNIQSFQVGVNILHEGLTAMKIQQPQNWNPEVYRTSEIVLNQNFSNEFIDSMGNKNYF